MLFETFKLRGLTLRNRIGMSPMCQYSADDGVPNDWHRVHLGARAVGGCGLTMAEATAVLPEGRITPGCTGFWSDAHTEAWAPIVRAIQEQGGAAAMQLAHAGRKASFEVPWLEPRGPITAEKPRGWQSVGPTDIPFRPSEPTPVALSIEAIQERIEAWTAAAQRAVDAGFDLIELHAAHGYLFHQFLSPLSNARTDAYGGDFAGRTRFLRETVESVRRVIPESMPLAVRVSATDWAEGGWTIEDTVQLAHELQPRGVDLFDCSSGGAVPVADIGSQIPLAAQVRREGGVASAAVGGITEAKEAEKIVAEGSADLVFLGRALLSDPHWAINAAKELGSPVPYPKQYRWVFER